MEAAHSLNRQNKFIIVHGLETQKPFI